jgi:HK97 family phage portal protein
MAPRVLSALLHGFGRRIFGSAAGYPPDHPFWYTKDPGSGMLIGDGGRVTPDTAITIGAVYRAVRLLADDVAQLPLHLYAEQPERRAPWGMAPGGKVRLRTPLAYVLGKRPNSRQTSFEFRQMLTSHVLLRGNGYARIIGDPTRGAVAELIPLRPDRMRPVLLDTGRVLYVYTNAQGREERLVQDEVFHLRGWTPDAEAVEGLSPIGVARRSLALTSATEDYGARQFTQSPRHSFILKHPQRLDEEVAKRISQSFRSSGAGPAGWGHTPVLEEGMDAVPVSMTHDDAQFLETRAFQITEIARWFGVPPHMIGDLSRSTFSNIEQQSIDYLTHSLMPWLVLWEQSIERDLILGDEKPEHVVEGLLRADSVARAQTEQLYVNMRATTPNEVRARNNWSPVPWGDDPAMPQGAPAPVQPGAGAAPPRPAAPSPDTDTEASAPPKRRARKPAAKAATPGVNRLNGVHHA